MSATAELIRPSTTPTVTPTMADLTGDLTPIDLDRLVTQAELLTRIDRKYIVPETLLPELVTDLPDETRVLEIDGRRSSDYHSLYLDTPDRVSFLDAGRKRRRRWKTRIRTYLDTATAFVEVKIPGACGSTVKERIERPATDPAFLVRQTLTGTERTFVAERIGTEPTALLEPALETSYQRSTLYLRDSGARVTVDEQLLFTSPQTRRTLGMPGRVIVETKSGAQPSAVDRLLWGSGHRPVSISKYGVGLAGLDPSLPRLKWHRTLDRHLDLPRAA